MRHNPTKMNRPRTAKGARGVLDADKSVPVQVIVRCRPLNKRERKERNSTMIRCEPTVGDTLTAHVKSGSRSLEKSYSFDKVLGPEIRQPDVYRTVAAPIVQEVLKGFNCTIFAYGQTGTGKTYTMEGLTSDAKLTLQKGGAVDKELMDQGGVVPRAVQNIFDHLGAAGTEYTAKVSFLELYNEVLTDLLDPSPEKPLRIFEDLKKGILVHGAEERIVDSPSDIYRILLESSARRHTAETLMNKFSSRSHTIFTIRLHMKETTPEGEEMLKVGQLNLVDLAGSENIQRSGAVKQARREAGLINQSLLTLGRVITSLVEHTPHIPYRESKLTRLLQESLGGRAKTCIIATISPASGSMDETMSTLEYASRAKNIHNRPKINEKMTKRALLSEYTKEIQALKDELHAAREKEGVFLPHKKFVEMTETLQARAHSNVELEERIKKMEEEMQEVQALFAKTGEELKQEKKQHEQTLKELDVTSATLETTEKARQQTRTKLVETRVVVVEQKKVDQALREHASELVSTLKETVQDVNKLHAKMDRKKQVDQKNNQATEAFREKQEQDLRAAQQRLSSFEAEYNQQCSLVTQSIHTFAKQRGENTAKVQSTLQSLYAMAREQGDARVKATVEHATQQDERLKNVAIVSKQGLEVAKDAWSSLSIAVTEATAQLQDQLSAQEDKFVEFAAKMEAQSAARTQLVQQFVSKQQKMLATLDTFAKDNEQVAVGALEKQQASIQALLEKQERTAQAQRDTMMQNMQRMMTQWADQQKQAMGLAHQELVKSTKAHTSDLHQATQKMHETTASALQSTQGFGSQVKQSQQQHVKDRTMFIEEVGEQGQVMQEDVQSMASTVTNMSEKAYEQLKMLEQEVETTLDAGKACAHAFVEQVQTTSAQDVGALKSGHALVHNALDAMTSTSVQQEASLEDQSNTLTTIAKDLVVDHGKQLSDASENMVAYFQSLQTLQRTGETPIRKPYPYRATAPPSVDQEDVIGDFRKQVASGEASEDLFNSPMTSVLPNAHPTSSPYVDRTLRELKSTPVGGSCKGTPPGNFAVARTKLRQPKLGEENETPIV